MKIALTTSIAGITAHTHTQAHTMSRSFQSEDAPIAHALAAYRFAGHLGGCSFVVFFFFDSLLLLHIRLPLSRFEPLAFTRSIEEKDLR